MLSTVKSMALDGLEGYLIEIQTDISNGIPSFDVVGLPDASIKEAKERVRIAIKNLNLDIPSRKILINLAPADRRKEGTIFDLPIAIGILTAVGKIRKEKFEDFERTIFLGELSLNGRINRVKGVLPMCIEASDLGIKKVILPKANAREAAVIKDLEIIPVSNLQEVIDFMNKEINLKSQKVDIKKILNNKEKFELDFSDVKGQENVKRALEIATAGFHNCALIGSPGSGKSMLAQRIPTILPDLTFEESLEITKIHSIAGNIKSGESIVKCRPFRSPHHTTSAVSISGGGRIPKPGEISLAHLGVLYLDELPEFNRNALEVLRGPLEDRKVTISRLNSTLTYPCNFMLVASMNPCMCGYYGSEDNKCTCSMQSISRYLSKISGPLLDRIDLHIEVKPVKYKNLGSNKKGESSEVIKERVNKAREIQLNRYKDFNIYTNGELTHSLIDRFCVIDETGKDILKKAFNNLGLSARAYDKILKIARTIADLDGEEYIKPNHIAEAIQYRSLDRKYWKK